MKAKRDCSSNSQCVGVQGSNSLREFYNCLKAYGTKTDYESYVYKKVQNHGKYRDDVCETILVSRFTLLHKVRF